MSAPVITLRASGRDPRRCGGSPSQEPGDVAEVVALRDYAEGEEATISYGRLGNAQLLTRGFVVESNP